MDGIIQKPLRCGIRLQPDMAQRNLLPGILFASCAAGLAAWAFLATDDEPPPNRAWGNVDTRQVSLAFEASGRIAELLPEEGTRVKAGEVLGRLDTTALEIDLRRAEAERKALAAQCGQAREGYRKEDVDRARKEAAAVEAELEGMRRTHERQKELDAMGATSRQLLEDSLYAERTLARRLEAARAHLRALEAGLRPQEVEAACARADAALAAVESLMDRIGRASFLRSPTNGIVRSRLAEPGDMAANGRTVLEIALTDPKWVRAYVTERQLQYVSEGTVARISTDTTEALPARVSFVSSVAEFTPKTVQTEDLRTLLVYEVKLTVPDPENRLRLGQPVTVDFLPADTP